MLPVAFGRGVLRDARRYGLLGFVVRLLWVTVVFSDHVRAAAQGPVHLGSSGTAAALTGDGQLCSVAVAGALLSSTT